MAKFNGFGGGPQNMQETRHRTHLRARKEEVTRADATALPYYNIPVFSAMRRIRGCLFPPASFPSMATTARTPRNRIAITQ